jgi:hypothetical protein
MNVKYQIFVSSTYEDLRDERNEVIKACLNMGHIPVGMEMFNAADEEQWAVITRTIDQCDYYVVIIAHRYGSTTPEGISFPEKEYDYAVAQGVPALGFVIADTGVRWPPQKDPKATEALCRFKSKVKKKMIRPWHNASELRAFFVESLTTTINLKPRPGWLRAPEAGSADIAQTLSNLTEENARLRQMLDELKSSSSSGSETNEVVRLLNSYVLTAEPRLTGSDVFPFLASQIEDEKEFQALVAELARECHLQSDLAVNLIKKLQLRNLVQPHDRNRRRANSRRWDVESISISTLRRNLKRRDSPPSARWSG